MTATKPPFSVAILEDKLLGWALNLSVRRSNFKVERHQWTYQRERKTSTEENGKQTNRSTQKKKKKICQWWFFSSLKSTCSNPIQTTKLIQKTTNENEVEYKKRRPTHKHVHLNSVLWASAQFLFQRLDENKTTTIKCNYSIGSSGNIQWIRTILDERRKVHLGLFYSLESNMFVPLRWQTHVKKKNQMVANESGRILHLHITSDTKNVLNICRSVVHQVKGSLPYSNGIKKSNSV